MQFYSAYIKISILTTGDDYKKCLLLTEAQLFQNKSNTDPIYYLSIEAKFYMPKKVRGEETVTAISVVPLSL